MTNIRPTELWKMQRARELRAQRIKATLLIVGGLLILAALLATWPE